MKKFFLAVIAMMMTVSVSAQFYIYLSNGEVLKADSISIPFRGALNGLFTINSDGGKISFSQGNLQYQASTDTWRFAEHQYDRIGNANSNISAAYTGWIDLFGWGTGSNPTNTSTNSTDYPTFTDWGVNAISNGGNKANAWRTLTDSEWKYLFYGRTNAATLFGFGKVNGVAGLIILPDNWTLPAGASFVASTTQGLENKGTYYRNSTPDNYSHNTYTAEQWAVMESAGAVFLPAAGDRSGTDVNDVDAAALYWSVTPDGTSLAITILFNSRDLNPQRSFERYYAESVRLVR